MGIPFGRVNLSSGIYPEVHLFAKLFEEIESKPTHPYPHNPRMHQAATDSYIDRKNFLESERTESGLQDYRIAIYRSPATDR